MQVKTRWQYLTPFLWVVFVLALVFAMTVNLESTPPVWWDEGWTLTVARTWVERGYYARILDGRIAPTGLEAAFPTTASVALSFRLLGVGLWQGRLVGVGFMLGTIALTYYLARQLYNKSVAKAALVVLLLLPLNPIVMGRQVLAEPTMMFFLLAAYASLLLTYKKSVWLLPLVMLLGGVGLNAKAQALPFWIVSLAAPLGLTLLTRYWNKAALILLALLGSLAMSRVLVLVQGLFLQGSPASEGTLAGIYEATAFVLAPGNRLFALETVFKYELPALFGLGYAAWKWKGKIVQRGGDVDVEIVKLALFVLSVSWLAWFLLLANAGISRYLFPPAYLASIFIAAMLYDWTDQFDFRTTLRNAPAVFRLKPSRRNVSALLAISLPAISFPVALLLLFYVYVVTPVTSAQEMAAYINTETPSGALIESYDSELFFFLNRRYHYPPDQINVPLVRQNFDRSATVDYDPLAADPDYLALGPSPFSYGWNFYEPAISSGAFNLVKQYGIYRLYERVR